ncbi:MAG: hypothetical protein JRI22_19140 [Deltaproteobacteria bacterium]|nr:hypothetical protein [Deltaproteobacteria bacterium]
MDETLQGTDKLECPHCQSKNVKGLGHIFGSGEQMMEVGGYPCECLDCNKMFFYDKKNQ